jgi:SAM-dependent methyltransferase
MTDDVLREQIEYYRERAPEYDEWFERRGMYDLGEEWNARWEADVAEVEAALAALRPSGRILELASGTGWWTKRLAAMASEVTAVDASDETIAIARTRAPSARFVRADIFGWEPSETYDFVFFSFWLSHVPADRFEAFWGLVGRALAPGGRVFFVDNLRREIPLPNESKFWQRELRPDGIVTRTLNDGREFRAVKIYYDPPDLEARLRGLGWDVSVQGTENFFYYGGGQRSG